MESLLPAIPNSNTSTVSSLATIDLNQFGSSYGKNNKDLKRVKENLAKFIEDGDAPLILCSSCDSMTEFNGRKWLQVQDIQRKQKTSNFIRKIDTTVLAIPKDALNLNVGRMQHCVFKTRTTKETLDQLLTLDETNIGDFFAKYNLSDHEKHGNYGEKTDDDVLKKGDAIKNRVKTPKNPSKYRTNSETSNSVSKSRSTTPEFPSTPKTSKFRSASSNSQNQPPIVFPSRQAQLENSAKSQNGNGGVFEFVGNPEKEPRVVKPGEIVFSASGSPIYIQQPQGQNGKNGLVIQNGQLNEEGEGEDEEDKVTPLFTTGKDTVRSNKKRQVSRPVRLKLDFDPKRTKSFEIELRGIEVGADQEHIFREFITDIRGLISTRSVQASKLGPSRAPPSASNRNTAPSRKPVWKN